jgi:hydrogenase expression/formation protein HypD
MKYIDEFRNTTVAQKLAEKISDCVRPKHVYKLMEFCGGHTHALHRYGLLDLLPKEIEMIHGPGCPVCVLPTNCIDTAIDLSKQPNSIFCSYADMLRIPGTDQHSLLKEKAQGADIRMVYSIDDALSIARKNPNKTIIFFAIGFETTTPPTAAALKTAKAENIDNFYVYCNHVLTPVAMQAILSVPGVAIDGFIGPAHVSTVIGYEAYAVVAKQFKKPIVISGFEPLDLLQSILQLVELINNQSYAVENQFSRAVTAQGNKLANQYMAEVFEVRDNFEWRGLGMIEKSALKIKPEFSRFDAEQHFQSSGSKNEGHKACLCGPILCGLAKPFDCKLFETVCTPENPLGACMVSSEGACAAYYTYGRDGRRL